MTEYIEREEATNVACNVLWKMNDLSTSVMAKALNSILAADVAPVKHGRWVCGDYYDVGDVCSECDWDSQMICPSYHFCPNCGAKMDSDWEVI